MNATVFKESRGRAEDEINVSGDVTVFKILSSAIQKNRVLPTKEVTVAKHHAIAIDANGQRLTYRTRSVFERDVLNGEIVSINERRRSSKCPDRFAIQAEHVRVQVISEHCLFRILTNQVHETFFVLHIDQLTVNSWLDANNRRLVEPGGLRHRVNG